MKTPFVLLLVSQVAAAATLEEGLALKREEKLVEAEQVFAELVAEDPHDAAALEQWATLLGWLGRKDEAVSAWRRALALDPDEPRYQMGLSRVQYWQGDLAPARARMEKLVVRKADVDTLTLAGDIYVASDDRPRAREMYRRARDLAPSPELDLKLARSADPPAWRLDAGGQVAAFDTRDTEGSWFAQMSYRVGRPLVLSAGYEQLHQFGFLDHRLNAGAYFVPATGVLLGGKVAVSPTADAVAGIDATGSADVELTRQVTATFMVRHMSFEDEGVTIVGPGARLTLGRVTLSAQAGAAASTAHSPKAFGAGRVEVAVTDGWQVYAGVARGREAQKLLPPATATDVVAGVTWQIDARWGLRLDYDFQDYGSFYRRHSAGSALTFHF